MFWTTVSDPNLGKLWYWWGRWRGGIHLDGNGVQLRIEIPRKVDVQPFLVRLTSMVLHYEQVKAAFADQLFEDYCSYRQMDMEQCGFKEEDYLPHPVVQSAADVWQALRPYQICHGNTIGRYLGNAYLLVNVDWPNPHFFQVFFHLGEGTWKHMHTELVG